MVSAALLLTGIALGSVVDRLPPRTVPTAGEFAILAGDFHVHAFPGDGTLTPWALRDEAAHAGLDVFAITNHNNTVATYLWRRFGGSTDGVIVIPGEEITNPAYHMIAAGTRATVSGRQPAANAIEEVHTQGGITIAAHPIRRFWNGYPNGALMLLDGSEVSHPDVRRISSARAEFAGFNARGQMLAHDGTFAVIGSSDVHIAPAMGACRTYLFVRERTEAGVLEAIRSGRTVASDEEGRSYGSPELVRQVESTRPAGRSDPNPGWRRFATLLAWLGVIGLLFFPDYNSEPRTSNRT